jgi:hypothetical protein
MKRGTGISGVALPIAHGSYALELEQVPDGCPPPFRPADYFRAADAPGE